MAIEKTYSMLKPDAVRNHHIGEIVSRIDARWPRYRAHGARWLSPSRLLRTTPSTRASLLYNGLIEYITSGPVVKMVVSRRRRRQEDAYPHGATNPAEAAPARFVKTWPHYGRKKYSRLRLAPSLPSVKSASSSVHK